LLLTLRVIDPYVSGIPIIAKNVSGMNIFASVAISLLFSTSVTTVRLLNDTT